MEQRPLEGFVFALTPFNFTAIGGNLPTSAAMCGNVVVWKAANTQVYSANFINITKTNISTSNWANGIYVVEIKADNGSVKNYKLIKQ